MGQKRQSTKNLEQARVLKAEKERYLRFSLLSLCAAVACLIAYSFIANTGILVSTGIEVGMATNLVFMVFAGLVGVCTHRWSKASRAFKEFIADKGVSERDL